MAAPPSGSQFVLLLGTVVPGLKVSTPSLVLVLRVIFVTSGTKTDNTLLAPLARFYHVFVLIPCRRTLRFVASHLIFLKSFCGTGRFLAFVSH